MPKHPEVIQQLAEWLSIHDPKAAIMPLARDKTPAYPHSKKGIAEAKQRGQLGVDYDEWKPDTYLTKKKTANYGFLANDIMVLDFDSQGAYDSFIQKFPDVVDETTPRAKTSRGIHLYFKRPQSIPVVNCNGFMNKVDLKTGYGNEEQTRSLISVPPSNGKSWILAPWDGVLREPCDAVMELLRSKFKPKVNTTSDPLRDGKERIFKGDAEGIQKLIDCFHPKRAEEYGTWCSGCWAIASAVHNDTDALNLMRYFSSKALDANTANNEAFFKSALLNRHHKYTLRSIHYWAKLDNPEKYAEYMNSLITTYVDACIGSDGAHYDVAMVAYKFTVDKYVYCPDLKLKHWVYINHRWNGSKEPTWTRKIISEQVVRVFMERTIYYSNQSLIQPELRDMMMEKQLKLTKVGVKLKTSNYKDGVIKELACLSARRNKDFNDLLDENPSLIGFNNGVFDLDTMSFRDGMPDDLITMTTGYDYSVEEDQDAQQELLDFVASIMPTQEMINYMWDNMAYAGSGDNKYQYENLHFWTGTGANGKGVLKAIRLASMGDYAIEADPSVVVNVKTNSSGASSELMALRGKRLVITSEPSTTVKLNISSIKQWSGGDDICARQLFGEQTSFKPQFRLDILMNNKPELNDVDGGIERRMNVVPFEFSFKPNPDPTKGNEKQLVDGLDKKFRDTKYKLAFFHLCMKRFQRVMKEGIVKPIEVINETRAYMGDNDRVRSFFDERIEITKEDKDIMSADELKREWERSEYYRKDKVGWFRDQLKRLGFKSVKHTQRDSKKDSKKDSKYHNRMVYYGIKVKEVATEEDTKGAEDSEVDE